MYFVSSAFLLGSFALQSVLGRPAFDERSLVQERQSSVDSFIKSESSVAIEQLLCNIGSDGCNSKNVATGIVIASPDTKDPDYFYTWTRDAALVFKYVVDRFINQYDAGLQRKIQEYIASQAKLQGVSNPSGSLSDGSGLGEAKFNVDMSAFTGGWGRPQRDGPALRATAMITYANWLIANGYTSTANDIVWPVVRNDLNYVAQYWNQTGFDLWEEVKGSSFFTTGSQYRGAALAKKLGKSGDNYSNIAPQALCFLQTYWISSGKYVDSNINVNDGRTGKDANSILSSIHNFDPALSCDPATFQPCSDKALANHKAVTDSFRSWNINKGISQGSAVAVGRYVEDVYYNGNPWYLATLAAAEQLYDAIYVWKQQGSITVSDVSLSFFKDLVSGISTGTYASDSATFKSITDAVSKYADGYVAIVAKYVGTDGHLAEQFDKNDGHPLSATDLTWSYAAFLSAADRRAGVVSPSWAGSVAAVPNQCGTNTVAGSYSLATATSFPASQTPKDGVPTPTGTQTSTSTSTSSSSTSTSCPIATSVAVTFEEVVTTNFGDTIKIVGNIAALGNWDTSKAIALSASDYTSSNPVWKATISLTAGQSIQYKYINVKKDGSLTWEKDPNRTYTVPKTCATKATKSDKWQS
ncbi:Six-hairpin glycosidase-like protein [Fusarium redolens]|uniref:Glucoamylase n=1 Tax=Fusarium redolens TaxID=48865 RepID=A0A9P9H255_FUSRE|nr:Six-hairpin glycosidase-like protein [Fusarium redolens]KAH7249790.1 Six-hairpin glycosidase-like protein [Fusarium redolens]